MARTIYKLADGTRVPSVTTIIGILGFSKDGLLYWANTAGLNGMTLEEARQDSATVGSIAHAMIEAELKGEPLDLDGVKPEVVEGARQAYEQWQEWRDLVGYKHVAAEESIVCEEHRYGGTFDAVMVKGKRVLVDWKTGGVYQDHLVQVAAYGRLWNSKHPEEPIEGYALLRLGRDAGRFTHYSYGAEGKDIDAGWRTFLLAREIYDLAKVLKKAVS